LSARFDAPRGLAVDSEGGIYVADANNHVIRYIAPDDGPVSTFAGPRPPSIEHGFNNGSLTSSTFVQPRDVALTANGLLIVSDNNGMIRSIDIKAQTVTTLCGSRETRGGTAEGKGSLAAFDEPAGVTADSEGNVYACDQDNHRLVVIRPDGDMKTLVRDQSRINAVIIDNDGSLLWTNGASHTIRKLVRGSLAPPIRSASGDELYQQYRDLESKSDYGAAYKKLCSASLTGHRQSIMKRSLALLFGMNLTNVDHGQARQLLKHAAIDSKVKVASPADQMYLDAIKCLYAEVLYHGYGGPVDRAAAISIWKASPHAYAKLALSWYVWRFPFLTLYARLYDPARPATMYNDRLQWNGSSSIIAVDQTAAKASASAAIAEADRNEGKDDVHIQLWRAIGNKEGWLPGGVPSSITSLRTLADTAGHTYAGVIAAELLSTSDPVMSRSLIARSASRALPLAMFLMAACQRSGFGGDIDLSSSEALLLRAKAAGHSGAHQLLAGRPVIIY
jgi:hypothetical protein